MPGVSCQGVAVELVVECPRCRAPMPLSGVVPTYACPGCTDRIRLPSLWWERVLFRAVAESLSLPAGKGRTARIRIVPGARLLYGPHPPRCGECRTELPLDDLMMRVNDGAEGTFCPECGGRVPMRPAPPELSQVHPLLLGVVGERLDSPPDRDGLAPRWYLLLQVVEDSG